MPIAISSTEISLKAAPSRNNNKYKKEEKLSVNNLR
jgi:hypothetical protein